MYKLFKKNVLRFTIVLFFGILAVSNNVFALGPLDGTGDPAPKAADVCADVPKDTLANIINFFSCIIIKTIVPLLFSLAIAGFIWGVIQYLINPESEEKKKKAREYIVWGIIGLFVMVSMWGLVGVLSNTFGVKTLIPQLSQ